MVMRSEFPSTKFIICKCFDMSTGCQHSERNRASPPFCSGDPRGRRALRGSEAAGAIDTRPCASPACRANSVGWTAGCARKRIQSLLGGGMG